MTILSKEERNAWADFLESGKVCFGREYLCSMDQETGEKCFCALGAYAEMRGVEWRRNSMGTWGFLGTGKLFHIASLPDQWVPCRIQNKITAINDRSTDFSAVAEFIRNGDWEAE